jgi:hypothetical protein
MNDEPGRVVAERELRTMQSRNRGREAQAESAARSLAGGVAYTHERT